MKPLHWTAGLHHDGSALYVSNPLPTYDEVVTITLRAPKDAPIRTVYLRTMPDGEIHLEPMQIARSDALCNYWTAPLPVKMPLNHYRFFVFSEEGVYNYNQLGCGLADTPDYEDFKLLADFTAPAWLEDRVFYQIFPDRFHNGDPSNDPQPGAWTRRGFEVQLRPWDAPPLPYKEAGNVDFYGGDLVGIQQKLDYLKDLGVNALYLNPIFTSTSNHRYNIDNFFEVDPHLGGDEALVALREALHAENMRLVLDTTPNHTGATHPWFREAQQDINAETADFYTFYEHPDDYERWLGVRSLPKLNYRSQKLRDTMYGDEDSILRYWLNPPFSIDGWRLDVYNMTARQGRLQLAEEIGRELRTAIKTNHPDAYVFGEHFFDGSPHLQGDQLDAVMNYQGFNTPIWRWLSGFLNSPDWQPGMAEMTRLPTGAFVEQLRRFRAVVPWVITRQQFNQLGSHDTHRILTIVDGDKALMRLGAAMLLTYPGVPCIYYGDEIGLEGKRDPDNRRTMPWDESEWDHDLLAFYRRLIHLRKTAPALREGGYQDLYTDDQMWVFQRQAAEQCLLVVGYRGPHSLDSVTIPVWQGGLPDGTQLTDLLGDFSTTVHNGMITLTHLRKGMVLVLESD